MSKVSEKDWEEFNYQQASTPILDNIIDGQAPNLHYGCIGALYKRYCLGDWNNEIPDPEYLEDKGYLAWASQTIYCLFHKKHEKFGENIIECGCLYQMNAFAFFDYDILEKVFDALNKRDATQTPHIPIYYAEVEDRHDYKAGRQLW